jgi:hypothetical protein
MLDRRRLMAIDACNKRRRDNHRPLNRWPDRTTERRDDGWCPDELIPDEVRFEGIGEPGDQQMYMENASDE